MSYSFNDEVCSIITSLLKAGEKLLDQLNPHKIDEDSAIGYGRLYTYDIYQCNVVLEYDVDSEDGLTIDISKLEAHTKGKGYGTLALKLLCELSDRYSVTLSLTAQAKDDKRCSTIRLLHWYKRNGFELFSDNDRNYDDDYRYCGYYMVRQPSKT